MSNAIKTVDVEYIENGTFVGGEEDCSRAGINDKTEYIVLKKSDYEQLLDRDWLFKEQSAATADALRDMIEPAYLSEHEE